MKYLLIPLLLMGCSKAADKQLTAFKCEDISTPRETFYELEVNPWKWREEYYFSTYDSSGKYRDYGLVAMDGRGTLVRNEDGLEVPLQISLRDYNLGESLEVYLQPRESNKQMHITLTPRPIFIEHGRYNLEFHRIDRSGESYNMYGNGFYPNENVDILVDTSATIFTYRAKANDNGEISASIQVSQRGVGNGLSKIELTPDHDCDEPFTFYLPWGKEYWRQNKIMHEQEERIEEELNPHEKEIEEVII
jgi:hypothetical protein